jgi:hypothetical protein
MSMSSMSSLNLNGTESTRRLVSAAKKEDLPVKKLSTISGCKETKRGPKYINMSMPIALFTSHWQTYLRVASSRSE